MGVPDERVDSTAEAFTWMWIQKATKLQKKSEFLKHLNDGHFGPWEQIGSNNWRLAEGHRAICRFNNHRFFTHKTPLVTREQYQDLISGRPMRSAVVMVGGKPVVKSISLANYNTKFFIAVQRYTNDQAVSLAIERIENDIEKKIVRWHDLDRESEEFQSYYNERLRMFSDLYIQEMMLVAKSSASPEEIKAAADLPLGITDLIDGKLSITQSEYYITRFVFYQRVWGSFKDNPALLYRIHQVILEEMRIEHLRDLQRLYGDTIDAPTDSALAKALDRHTKMMPMRNIKAGTSSNGNKQTEVSERKAPMSATDDPFSGDGQ